MSVYHHLHSGLITSNSLRKNVKCEGMSGKLKEKMQSGEPLLVQ